jgi:uncharacterized glyoxalase superfamily protein PhnB
MGSHSFKLRVIPVPTLVRMTIHATLRYDDADAAITFLTGTLGLTSSREYAVADPEGTVWSVGTYRP